MTLVGVGTKPYIGLRQPVLTSPYDTRPAWRIAKELGTALGVGDYFAYDNFEDYLQARLVGTGTTLDELKTKGIHFTQASKTPYLDDSEDFHWHTPSGKVELYSQQLEDKGFDPLPVHRPPDPPPAGFMRLLYGRSPLHTFGRTQNNALLFDIDPSNCVWIHPDCAKQIGLQHGMAVLVENQHGESTGPLPLRLTERVQPRTAYMVHGFGHRSKQMHLACCSGGSDTDIIHDYAIDPITGSTGMRVQFIRLRAADEGAEVKPCAMR